MAWPLALRLREDVETMAGKQRKVKAATVLAWWNGITIKLAADPTDMTTRGLENALYFVCRKNGAMLKRGVVGVPPQNAQSLAGNAAPAAAFDWEHGEMVFEVLQPEGLIAELEQATGIPEHDAAQTAGPA